MSGRPASATAALGPAFGGPILAGRLNPFVCVRFQPVERKTLLLHRVLHAASLMRFGMGLPGFIVVGRRFRIAPSR